MPYKITEKRTWNPIIWLLQFVLGRIVPFEKSMVVPAIIEKHEYWFKSPEQTLKDGYGNCVNVALMRYKYLYTIKCQEWIKGITYVRIGNEYHSDFALINKKNNEVKIILNMDIESDLAYPSFWFITPNKVYEVTAE
jgi:hypothetical protein